MRREPLVVGVAAAAVGLSRWLARARVPDDYDSIGFVRALDRFDLAAFQPHPPGYPVYVALGKLAHAALPALDAACLVSALAAAATAVALYVLARTLAGERAGQVALGLFAVAWMPIFLGGAALSESAAGAFAGWAAALAARRRWSASALMVALMLGARPSWWALAASWIALVILEERRAAWRPLLALAAGTAAWALPFALVVGHPLAGLARTHVAGHFADWGGTIATRPRLGPRAYAFARDLLVDGLVPNRWLALAFAFPFAFALASRVRVPVRVPVPVLVRVAVVILPYALWAFFAQNILDQPRHVYPLVLASILLLAVTLARRPLLAVAALALAATASVPLAIRRVRVPPAAAQAATWIPANTHDAVVFGARSIRFLPSTIPSIPRTWLSEVDVELERLDRLPAEVVVTSEVEADPTRVGRLHPLATFCRDPRLDRQQPCLTLFRYGR